MLPMLPMLPSANSLGGRQLSGVPRKTLVQQKQRLNVLHSFKQTSLQLTACRGASKLCSRIGKPPLLNIDASLDSGLWALCFQVGGKLAN